ncbi:MAG TPA: preprotein translocase subunit YajC [Flavobacteriaceae bacterium]|nr:preprotein translocase subunit YajC [Flavobacteriaceae bacterium]
MEGISGFLPLILLFLVMYLFLIRPQMQKAKKEKKFAAELQKGARVVTIGGIHGKLIDLYDDGTCLIDIGAGRVKFEKAAISMDKTNQLNAPEKK